MYRSIYISKRMLSFVILKKVVYKFAIYLLISCCYKSILFYSFAWSAWVYRSWACILRCDSFILSNLSSRLWILKDWKSSPGANEEAPAIELARLSLALFAILLSTAGPEGGSVALTTGYSTISVLGAMKFLFHRSDSTFAIEEVNCAPVSRGSSQLVGT